MSKKDDGGPAFPRTQWTGSDKNAAHRDVPGMALRDWFAGQALSSIIEGARKILMATEQMPSADRPASAAYVLADAMMAERSKE